MTRWPSIPCALGRLVPESADIEQIKRDGWNKHGILVVRADDERLGWIEQKVILEIGKRLYGQKGLRIDRQ